MNEKTKMKKCRHVELKENMVLTEREAANLEKIFIEALNSGTLCKTMSPCGSRCFLKTGHKGKHGWWVGRRVYSTW